MSGSDLTRRHLFWTLGGEDGRTPVPTTEVGEWGRMFESANRRVARDELRGPRYWGEVSTVFLGIDHNLLRGERGRKVEAMAAQTQSPPEADVAARKLLPDALLFETMIFGGFYGGQTWRYPTWDEAKAGHDRVVAALRKGRQP